MSVRNRLLLSVAAIGLAAALVGLVQPLPSLVPPAPAGRLLDRPERLEPSPRRHPLRAHPRPARARAGAQYQPWESQNALAFSAEP